MGIRFNIQSANWIAYIIEPDATIPNLHSPQAEYDTLIDFLEGLRGGFFSSFTREHQLNEQIRSILLRMRQEEDILSKGIPYEMLQDLIPNCETN